MRPALNGCEITADTESDAAADTTLVASAAASGAGIVLRPARLALAGAHRRGAPASFAGTSADGEIVFFTTTDQLVPGDTDLVDDVYERSYDDALGKLRDPRGLDRPDRRQRRLRRLLRGISADGTEIFFTTEESLVAADGDHAEDIYLRDLATTRRSRLRRRPACAAQDCGNGVVRRRLRRRGCPPTAGRLLQRRRAPAAPTTTTPSTSTPRPRRPRPSSSRSPTASCLAATSAGAATPSSFRGATIRRRTRPSSATGEQLATGDDDGAADIYVRDLGGQHDRAGLRRRQLPGPVRRQTAALLRRRLERRLPRLLRDQRAAGLGATPTARRTSTTGRRAPRAALDRARCGATAPATRPSPVLLRTAPAVFFETSESSSPPMPTRPSTSTSARGGITTSSPPGRRAGTAPSRPASFAGSRRHGASAVDPFSTDEPLVADDLDTHRTSTRAPAA